MKYQECRCCGATLTLINSKMLGKCLRCFAEIEKLVNQTRHGSAMWVVQPNPKKW